MSMGYLLVDGNSLGFAAQMSTRLTVGGKETQAIFGSLRMIRPLIEQNIVLRPVVLWDGRSWRKEIDAEYKANRDDNPKMRVMRNTYKAQRPQISRGYKLLGVSQMFALNMEADDLAALLVRKALHEGKKAVMITADKDWLQLVGPRISWYDPIHDIRVNEGNFTEVTGYASPRAFLEGKALQGDTSDNIGGVGGIGEVGAKKLLDQFGSVDAFLAAPSAGKLPKRWQEFLLNTNHGQDTFTRNMRLMELGTKHMPAPVKLSHNAGALDVAGFTEFCHEHAFQSILRELSRWLEPFRMLAEERAAA